LRLVKEEKPLGTIGALKRIEGLEEDFLLMNGDLLTTLPFSEVLDKRREKKSLALLTVGERTVTLDFGLLDTDAAGCVVRYKEKPTLTNLVSYGVYAFSRDVLDWIPDEEAFDLPDLVQLLIGGNRRVDTFLYNGYWKDIGRPEDYEAAKADFLAEPGKFLA
jgi:NDP-sugar pyrophosphorylase family protein